MISPLPDPLVELEGLTVLLLPLGPLGEEGADSVPSLLSWSLIIKRCKKPGILNYNAT